MDNFLDEVGKASVNVPQNSLQPKHSGVSGGEDDMDSTEDVSSRNSSKSSKSSNSSSSSSNKNHEKRERRSKKAAEAESSSSSSSSTPFPPSPALAPAPASTSTSSAAEVAAGQPLSVFKKSSQKKRPTYHKKRAAMAEKPKYVGQGIRQSGNRIYYEALVIKGDQYIRSGDAILLQSGETGGIPYICRVSDMWCESSREEAMIRGQWFYRRSDIDPTHIETSIQQITTGSNSEEDIFLSKEGQKNSAETVLCKIIIVYGDDSVHSIRAKKERAKITKTPLYHCNFKYNSRVKKGASHFTKYKSSLVRVPEPELLSIKEEQIAIGSSHRRGVSVGSVGSGGSGGSGSSSSKSRKSVKRSHAEADFDVQRLLGLERRKSVEFLDPMGGEYTYTIFGGSSFKEDGTIIQTKRRKTSNSKDKREKGSAQGSQFSGE